VKRKRERRVDVHVEWHKWTRARGKFEPHYDEAVHVSVLILVPQATYCFRMGAGCAFIPRTLNIFEKPSLGKRKALCAVLVNFGSRTTPLTA
jgi:hypothetical protein